MILSAAFCFLANAAPAAPDAVGVVLWQDDSRPARALAKALRRSGRVRIEAAGPRPAGAGDAERARALEAPGVSALLEVTAPAGRRLSVIVWEARDTQQVGRWSPSARSRKRLLRKIRRRAWKKLGPIILNARRALPSMRVYWVAKGPVPPNTALREQMAADMPSLQWVDAPSAADVELASRFRRARKRWRGEVRLTATRGGETESVRRVGRRWASVLKPLSRAVERALSRMTPTAGATADDPPLPATGAVEPASAPPAPAVERAAQAPSSSSGPAGLRLEAGLGVRMRFLRYRDDAFGALRPYDLGGVPQVALAAEYAPGLAGALSGLSVYGDGRFVFATRSEDPDGNVFPTTAWAISGGGRYRIALGRWGVFPELGLGHDRFSLQDADGGQTPELPSVAYTFLRVGAGLGYEAGAFHLGLSAGWRPILSAGGILGDDWFPRGGAQGLDLTASGTRAIGEAFAVSLRLNLTRYFFAFRPEPGDARVAGGATDQYLGAMLALSWRPS